MFSLESVRIILVLYVHLDGGKKGLLTLKEDFTAMETESGAAKGEGEVRRHELL